MNENEPSARPACEHHWVSKHQPDFPPEIYWVAICSMCGDVSGAGLTEELAEMRQKLITAEAWTEYLLASSYGDAE